LNYDLRDVAQGSFNAIVPPGELTQEAWEAGVKLGGYDGLLKWHGLNPPGFDSDMDLLVDEDPKDFDPNDSSLPIDNDLDGLFNEDPELGDNTIKSPGDIVNIGFQFFPCPPENDDFPAFDTCIDADGIVLQSGFYNEQTVEEFTTLPTNPVCVVVDDIVVDERPVCNQQLLEIVLLDPGQFFFLRVTQIDDFAGTTLSSTSGFGPIDIGTPIEFVLFQEEEEGFGGFYNFYWDTNLSGRTLPGKGAYAIDIMFFDGVEEKLMVDSNDNGAFRQYIRNSITDDPNVSGLQGFRNDKDTSFILIVLEDAT